MANTKISGLSSATTPLSGSEIIPLNQSGVTDSVSVANLTVGRDITTGAITSTISSSGSYNSLQVNNTNSGGYARTLYSIGSGGANGVASVKYAPGIFFSIGPESNDTTTPIVFKTNNGTTQFTIDITGNLIPNVAGKGINFTANTPASGMTSQNLTWYEEGTWTPAPNSGSFSAATGRYTRIGRVVNINFDVTVGTGGGTTMTAPIASGVTTANGIYTSGQTYAVGTTSPTVVIGASGSTLYFRTVGSAVGFSAMTLTAGAAITGNLTYSV